MVEISKAIFEKNGRYLLLQRASHSQSYPDLWDFPGGKHEPGETSQQSVIREVKEETSFDIEPGEEIKLAAYKDDKHDLLFHYFIPSSVSGELKLSPDHSDYKWVEIKELNGLTRHPSVVLFFAKMQH